MIQKSSITSAIDKVGSIILENHIKGCVAESIKHDDKEKTDITIKELMDTINKFTK